MEGPSLVIACEEFQPFIGKKIKAATGSAKIAFPKIKGAIFERARSWGKHLILEFSTLSLRIHFLMFGSYRINKPRENRFAKMELQIGKDKIYFYSCAIKVFEKNFEQDYDWTVDLMSPQWNPGQALKALRQKSKSTVGDVLMDQAIFSGLGNIMKNEILYILKMHPESKIEDLPPARLRALVKICRDYAWQFYNWKKKNVLKRNWKIMRKKTCPRCEGRVTKRATGRLKRLSHWCPQCQTKGQ